MNENMDISDFKRFHPFFILNIIYTYSAIHGGD